MKIIFCGLVLLAMTGCNENDTGTANLSGPPDEAVHTDVINSSGNSSKIILQDGCYEMTMKKDTGRMKLIIEDSIVTGDLDYDWFEKDGNKGTFKGVIRDSLILADYTFKSEGMISVRELVFKIRDSSLYAGFGPLTDRNGKIVFTDNQKIEFDSIAPFMKIPCM
jgi:hypothetical protein